MRFLVPLMLALSTFSIQAIDLTPRQQSDLKKDAELMRQALQNNDVETITDLIFTPVLEFVGGKDNFIKAVERTYMAYQRPGYALESITVGEPEIVVAADPFVVAFLPTTTIVKTPNNKTILTGFVVGVLSENENGWKFFDGAVTQADINTFYQILPNLPLDIVLPPIQTQRIESIDHHISQGKIFYDEGMLELSISSYSQAIEIDPDPEAFVLRSAAYRDLGKTTESIADASNAIEMKSDYLEAYKERGKTYLKIREDEKAILDFSTIIEFDPRDKDAYFYRGLAYAILDRCKEAISDYTSYIKEDKDNEIVYSSRAECYLQEKDNKKAVRDAEKAIQINPNYESAYLVLGQAQIANKRIEQGCATFRGVCPLANCVPVYMKKEKQICEKLVRDSKVSRSSSKISRQANKVFARVMEVAGDFKSPTAVGSAIDDLLNADTSRWSEYEKAQLHYMLGGFYVNLGDYSMAISEYEKYVHTLSVPESQALAVTYSLGQLYLAVEDYKKAVIAFEYYIPRIANVKSDQVFLLGQAYYMADNHSQAATYFSTAIEMKEKSEGRASEAWYKFQYATYLELNDIARAVSILHKMDSYYPSEETSALIKKLSR